MKILYDARFITPGKTGVGRYADSLLKALLHFAPQCTIDVLVYDPIDIPKTVHRIRAPVAFDSHPQGEIYRNFRLPRLLDENDYSLYFSPAFYSVERKMKTPQVVTIHDMAVFHEPAWFPARFSIFLKTLIRLSVRSADILITFSEYISHQLQEYCKVSPDKIRVIPYSVDPVFARHPARMSRKLKDAWRLPDKFILNVSTLEPRKNLATLFDAYRIYCRRTAHPIPLIIAGKSGYKGMQIRRYAESFEVSSNIRFLGYVRDEDVAALYQSAELTVFPSLYEGYGLPVLEAMASGCPVVTSDVTSLPEVAKDAAILVNPQSAVEISDAMLRVLAEPDLAARLREKGFKRISDLSWENTAKQMCEVFTFLEKGNRND